MQKFENYIGQYIEIRFGADDRAGGILRSCIDGWLSIELGKPVHHMTDKFDTFLPVGKTKIAIKADSVWMVSHREVITCI